MACFYRFDRTVADLDSDQGLGLRVLGCWGFRV